MVSFEIFVKAMPPSLSEIKVRPSFCFAFKIPDDVAASTKEKMLRIAIRNFFCVCVCVCDFCRSEKFSEIKLPLGSVKTTKIRSVCFYKKEAHPSSLEVNLHACFT